MVGEYTQTELEEVEHIVNYGLYRDEDQECVHFTYDHLPADIIKIPFIFAMVLEVQSLVDSLEEVGMAEVDAIASQFNCTVKKKQTDENVFVKLITAHCQPLNCVEFVFDHVDDPALFVYFVR